MRAELTRKGWSLLGAATGLFVASRLLGSRELAALAVVAAGLLAAVLVWVHGQRPELVATRTIAPRPLHAGADARVDLVVRNPGHRNTPVLAVSDLVGRRRAARFLLGSLAPGASERAAYRIPAMRRGRNEIGPLTVTVTDPFGLARRRSVAGAVDEVIVRPRVHPLLAPQPSGGARLASSETYRSRAASPERGEFLGLREYEVGDDLRRVHWRSTARQGHLMIRQDEARRLPRVAILLDDREEAHDAASFELALEAVASIASALDRARRAVTVMLASGPRIDAGPATDLGLLLDRLAIAELAPTNDLLTAAAYWQRAHRESLLVVVTGAPTGQEVLALGRLGNAAASLLVVATRPGAPDDVIDASTDLPTAWNRAAMARGATVAAPR